MNSHSLRRGGIICFAALIVLVSTNCSTTTEATPTVAPTSTPERLRLIDGEIDPCLLINSEEVEAVIGVKVSSEAKLLDYMPSCKYISAIYDPGVLLIVSAVTDVSIAKANQPWMEDKGVPISAVKAYESYRMAASRLAEIIEFKDLDNLGDQAFLEKTSFLTINMLRNDIFYMFSGKTEYGVGQDALMMLIKIAMERMP